MGDMMLICEFDGATSVGKTVFSIVDADNFCKHDEIIYLVCSA